MLYRVTDGVIVLPSEGQAESPAARGGAAAERAAPGSAVPFSRLTPLVSEVASSPVLIVDDEPSNLRVLERILRRAGFTDVCGTCDPWHAMELARRGGADLLIADLHMPGADATEVIRRIRAEASDGALLPVLVYSGDLSAEAKERALASGARDFIAKPFDTVELLLRIRNLLEMRMLHRALQRQNEELEAKVRSRTRALRRDIARRKRAEARVRGSEQRFRSLVEAASDIIFRCDRRGRLTYVNPEGLRVAGASEEALSGRRALRCVPPSHRSSVLRAVCTSIREGTGRAYCEVPVRTAGGEEVWVGASIQVLDEKDGGPTILVVARNISARMAAERAKDEFLSVISHELRTPVTAIRASVGLLASEALPDPSGRAVRLLDTAARNCGRLTHLIDDILDLERLRTGSLLLQRQTCPVAELLGQAAQAVQSTAETAGIALEVEPVEATAWADPERVSQILLNLLSNAIKFSPRGSRVTLRARAEPGWIRLQVEDRGRGIPADRIEQIFERFHQVNASDAREKGGTGLGLAISRSLAEAHGGRVWAESEMGKGSTFHVMLPAAPDR